MPDRSSIVLSRRNRRLDQQRTRASGLRRVGVGLGILLSIATAVLILLAALAYSDLTRDLPNVALLPALLNPPDGMLLQPTRFYDRTGQHLLYEFSAPTVTHSGAPASTDVRRYIPLSPAAPQHLPDLLARATVVLADPGFWTSGGYSLSGLADPDTHPTIAQKLVSDLLLYGEQPSLRRALRERILAAQLTARYGRSQVLEWYLNSADYGNDAYGIDAAAQFYFGVSATDLTPAESAVLAATSQASGLNPLDARALAIRRGVTAVQLMRDFGLITADAARSADASLTPAALPTPPTVTRQAPSGFSSLVLRQLDAQFTAGRIRRGGLIVITTLDYDLQQGVSCTTLTFSRTGAAGSCTNLPSTPGGGAAGEGSATGSSQPSTASLVLDPQSGQVLAAVGETLRGLETPYLSPHDPGSLMTPFVYLTAFTRGFSPGSLVWDIPPANSGDGSTGGSPQSSIVNLRSEISHGPVRMRVALANDYLFAAEKIAAQMGSDAVDRTESSFGLSSPIEGGSAGEGVGQQTLLDMASAYAVFAANGVRYGSPLPVVDGEAQAQGGPGVRVGPTAVLRIEGVDHSVWLDLSNPQVLPVVTPALAYLMNSALSDESARWPSLGHPNDLEIGRPLGVKLGQSADGSDSWSIGYTPSRLVAVWVGLQPQVTQSAANAQPAGSDNQESLLSSLIQLATALLPADGWAAPAGVTTVQVCDPSGLLPTPDCPTTVNEVFLSGNEPAQPDTLFRSYTVNRETGFLATVFTPPDLVVNKVYMVVPPEAQDWAKAANIPAAPSSFDAIQSPPLDPNVHISTPTMFADVSGKVQFRGTASGTQFDHYRLLVGQGLNPQSWVVVTDSATRVEDGLLGAWDTTGLTGLYAVELQVIRTDQRIDTAITQVTVK